MSDYIFIRHARPDFPLGERRCIGRTDISLGALGRMQACLLGETVHFPVVYSSPLKRAVETAAYIADDVIAVPGLEEAYCGEWDGLSFDEIRSRWPEQYEARGRDQTLAMPGGEPVDAAGLRFAAALKDVPEGSAVVAHNMVICEYLKIKQGHRFPYAAVIENGLAREAHPEMTPELARKLRAAAGIPQKIERHCDAVAAEALRLSNGLGLDSNIIECAAILHDVARLENRHEITGGRYLTELGYPEFGDAIRQHGTPDSDSVINEAAILFLADKYMSNTEHVSIDVRYDRTAEKCKTPEALEKHEISRRTAKKIEKLLAEERSARGLPATL